MSVSFQTPGARHYATARAVKIQHDREMLNRGHADDATTDEPGGHENRVVNTMSGKINLGRRDLAELTEAGSTPKSSPCHVEHIIPSALCK
jgi:hypothetical protein